MTTFVPLAQETGEQPETMTSKDAMMFPLIASCALFGLYVFFKASVSLTDNGCVMIASFSDLLEGVHQPAPHWLLLFAGRARFVSHFVALAGTGAARVVPTHSIPLAVHARGSWPQSGANRLQGLQLLTWSNCPQLICAEYSSLPPTFSRSEWRRPWACGT